MSQPAARDNKSSTIYHTGDKGKAGKASQIVLLCGEKQAPQIFFLFLHLPSRSGISGSSHDSKVGFRRGGELRSGPLYLRSVEHNSAPAIERDPALRFPQARTTAVPPGRETRAARQLSEHQGRDGQESLAGSDGEPIGGRQTQAEHTLERKVISGGEGRPNRQKHL